jgi:hypothetical protein
MSDHPNPNLTPDPREEKLPVWVRTTLHALRRDIRDLEAVAASVRGEHKGSNVEMVDMTRINRTPLPKDSMIRFANNWGGITVYHDRDGRVCVQGDNSLILHMSASNMFTVELDG